MKKDNKYRLDNVPAVPSRAFTNSSHEPYAYLGCGHVNPSEAKSFFKKLRRQFAWYSPKNVSASFVLSHSSSWHSFFLLPNSVSKILALEICSRAASQCSRTRVPSGASLGTALPPFCLLYAQYTCDEIQHRRASGSTVSLTPCRHNANTGLYGIKPSP